MKLDPPLGRKFLRIAIKLGNDEAKLILGEHLLSLNKKASREGRKLLREAVEDDVPGAKTALGHELMQPK